MTRTRLVLVHGTRVSRTQWDLPAYAGLVRGLDVVAPDLPGHGRRQGERFTTAAAVATIADAVEAGDRRAPVVVAGHSLGGYMAMAYAAQHPRRLAGLALIGASAEPRGPGAAAYRAFASLIDRVGAERMARMSDRALARLAGADATAAVMAGGASYEATADAWAAVMHDCSPALLRHLRCPVLLMSGQYDQMRLHARRFADQCGEARVVLVPGATHLLPITHPEVVAAELRAFAEHAARRWEAGAGAPT